MSPSSSVFPSGRAGLGLIALRVATGATLLAPYAIADGPVTPRAMAAATVAALLLPGLFTRLVSFAALMLLVTGIGLYGGPPGLGWLAAIAQAGSVTLLGAGAYSLDARLFGRRVIHLRSE